MDLTMPRYNFATRRYELPRDPWPPRCVGGCGREVKAAGNICLNCYLAEAHTADQPDGAA